MENASKALIIAGAILLSIILISLGIMVVNNARNTVNNSNLDSTEISAFNSQWEAYCGKGKSANQVSTLVSAVISSNATETRTGSNRMITVEYGAGANGNTDVPAAQPTTVPTFSQAQQYNVSATYINGLITNLKIDKKP